MKRNLNDNGIIAPIQTIVIAIVVIFILVFGAMWVAVGGNPLGTHEFVDVEVDVAAVDYFGFGLVEIGNTDHRVTERKGYEGLELSWWDPASAEVTVNIRLLVNGNLIDTDSSTKDITITSGYYETFVLTTGPLPDDWQSYTVEIEVISDGEVEDSTTLTGG